MAASSFWALGTAAAFVREPQSGKPELLDELTQEELGLVESSVMGRDLGNYFGKGYSCAESGLMAALNYLEKPEELVWAAGGFGGGLAHGDLCGFLTAGVMAIGFAAGDFPFDEKESKKQCRLMVESYWETWTSMAPLHCSEIREGRTDFKVCHRLGRLAGARLEKLLELTRGNLRVT